MWRTIALLAGLLGLQLPGQEAPRAESRMEASRAAAPARMNEQGSDGLCPVHREAREGRTAALALLLARGAAVDVRDAAGRTPLIHAAEGGHLEAVRLLLDRGADFAARDAEGRSAIYRATRAGRTAIVQHLADRGADLREAAKGYTLLYWAAWHGHHDLAKFLVRRGVPLEVTPDYGRTALMNAAFNGFPGIADLLVKAGASLEATDQEGRTALVHTLEHGHGEVAALLLRAGARTDVRDPDTGATPLHLAAARGYGDVCSHLLAAGAARETRDRSGETPRDTARRHGNRAVAALLGQAPAPVPEAVPAEGTAVVWYLGHSGWAVRTRNHLLVFDYWKPWRLPDEPCLANGVITPASLKGLQVAVFVSHAHPDHHAPVIWSWRKDLPGIAYVLGFPPPEGEVCVQPRPRETTRLGGLEITAIASTDSGQGFLVKADGVTIFHPGDHANAWRDFSGPFKGEVDALADAGHRVDILFVPVAGCGFSDKVSLARGNRYLIDRLSARTVFPMHAFGTEATHLRHAEDLRKAGYDLPIHVARVPGDHFEVDPR